MGKQLDNMTRAMGRRLPIVVKEGNEGLRILLKLPS
jgi:hypothetical protein